MAHSVDLGLDKGSFAMTAVCCVLPLHSVQCSHNVTMNGQMVFDIVYTYGRGMCVLGPRARWLAVG